MLLGGLLGGLLWGLGITVVVILKWMGMDPFGSCWPVAKVFPILILVSMAVMFVVLIPVLIIAGIIVAIIEYSKGIRIGRESQRRQEFIPFCKRRFAEMRRDVWAMAVWYGNKVGIGAFLTLLFLSWAFGTPTLTFAGQSCA